ncbi:hypothetical protein DICPUDRAFT_74540 [Dictyostelium purpureum]|uniref:Uncharacterized protein n=1 Tax=Dictyostelium purpureum TaxID=5786 RepID=F0Z816_DICPU|nr:uncharacterized protein DICPUDRAFT_74540 [Dictyostelium purpureum]EGC39942.1 hypothetical protein DICPUDRAFT_74540 [Dictyostelium purpureum]|eukprot:XP_003283571.1 hypothetical protein DICPUDRAFT_74540 [Dictyostelium purpureum]
MVLLLPSKRKFFHSLKEKFEINNINSNDNDIEDITNCILGGNENDSAVLYIVWNDIGLMQRVSLNLHNVHSMKVSIGNFLKSHGGVDYGANSILKFQHLNLLINCLQLFFTNSDFKWSRRQNDKEDCCQVFVISKEYDQYEPIITRQPFLFNLTLNFNDPLFSITSNATSSSSFIVDCIIGHSGKDENINYDVKSNTETDMAKSKQFANNQPKHDYQHHTSSTTSLPPGQ